MNWYKKAYYSDYNTLPGFLPSRNRPNSNPNILFTNDKTPGSEEDIIRRWKEKQKGLKTRKVYQTGDIIPVIDNGEKIPLIPV